MNIHKLASFIRINHISNFWVFCSTSLFVLTFTKQSLCNKMVIYIGLTMRAATKKLQEPKVPLGLMYHNDPYLNEEVGPYYSSEPKVFCITKTRRNNNIPNNTEDVEIENL